MSGDPMNLYRIEFDSEMYWVEAPTFAAAIEKWGEHCRGLWGEDYDGTEQPESVQLVDTKAVIR